MSSWLALGLVTASRCAPRLTRPAGPVRSGPGCSRRPGEGVGPRGRPRRRAARTRRRRHPPALGVSGHARRGRPDRGSRGRAAPGRARDPGRGRARRVSRRAIWGVFAAEGERLRATPSDQGEWTVTGTKPWCSLADRISHALVTAWVDDSRRGLFAVDLRHPGVRRQRGHAPWAARGLVQVRSTGLELDRSRHCRSVRPGGTSSGPDSPGVASASPRSGTAEPWPWLVGCATPRPTASPTRSRWHTSAPSTSPSTGHGPSWSKRPRSSTDRRSQPRSRPDSPCGPVRSSPTRWRRCSCAPVMRWVPDRSPPRASTRDG